MVRESEVRENLVDVLQGELSLEKFADWLSSARRNMHHDSSSEAQTLVTSVSLLLYQHFEGHLRNGALREELVKLVDNVVINWELVPRSIVMQSSSKSQQVQAAFAIPA
jgi:hypothetical protein